MTNHPEHIGHNDDHKMKMASINELRAGDVLLCYKDAKFDPVGGAITHVTNSEYTHAAICIDSCTAAESTVLGGVAKVKVHDFVKRYDHIAVFRSGPGCLNSFPRFISGPWADCGDRSGGGREARIPLPWRPAGGSAAMKRFLAALAVLVACFANFSLAQSLSVLTCPL